MGLFLFSACYQLARVSPLPNCFPVTRDFDCRANIESCDVWIFQNKLLPRQLYNDDPPITFLFELAGDSYFRRIQNVTSIFQRRFQRGERSGLVRFWSEYTEALLDVGDFDLFEFGCVVQTAHGLLNVVHSI